MAEVEEEAAVAVAVEYVGLTMENMEVQVRVDTSKCLSARILTRSKLKQDQVDSHGAMQILYRLVVCFMFTTLCGVALLLSEALMMEETTCTVLHVNKVTFTDATPTVFCRVDFQVVAEDLRAPDVFVFSSGSADMDQCNETFSKASSGDVLRCFYLPREGVSLAWVVARSVRVYGYLDSRWNCMWDVFSGLSSLCIPVILSGVYIFAAGYIRLAMIPRVTILPSPLAVPIYVDLDNIAIIKNRVQDMYHLPVSWLLVTFLGRELHNQIMVKNAFGDLAESGAKAELMVPPYVALYIMFRGVIPLELRVAEDSASSAASVGSGQRKSILREPSGQLGGPQRSGASSMLAAHAVHPATAKVIHQTTATSHKIVHSNLLGRFLEEYLWQASRVAIILGLAVWGMVSACALPWGPPYWGIALHLIYLPAQFCFVILPVVIVGMIFDLHLIRGSFQGFFGVSVLAMAFFLSAGVARASAVSGPQMWACTVGVILGCCVAMIWLCVSPLHNLGFAELFWGSFTMLLMNFFLFIVYVVGWYQHASPYLQVGIQVLINVICQGITLLISLLVDRIGQKESNLFLLPVMSRLATALQTRFLQLNVPDLPTLLGTQLAMEALNLVVFLVSYYMLRKTYPTRGHVQEVLVREKDVAHEDNGGAHTVISGLMGLVSVKRRHCTAAPVEKPAEGAQLGNPSWAFPVGRPGNAGAGGGGVAASESDGSAGEAPRSAEAKDIAKSPVMFGTLQ
eukprot:RCo020798